jgi:hypothetical protein
MATCFLAPDPVQSTFFIPGGNIPGNGSQVFFYAAGSSTKQTAYKDPAGATPWVNPIALDSGGNLPLGGEVWFVGGQTYKVVWAPFNDTDPPGSPYRTMDNLSGTNDVSIQTGVEWISGPTPTFVSGTSFTLVGDQRTNFTLGRRLKTTNTGGTVYSTIVVSAFSALTTVTVVNDSPGQLDSGLSAVTYGLLDPSHSSIDFYHVGKDGGTTSTNVSGTTDIWGIPGTQIHINNTNAINSFSTASYAGAERVVIADVSFPINTSSILSIPGGQNVTTNAGDRFGIIASTQTASVITWYQRNSGAPLGSLQVSGSVLIGPSSGANAVPTYRNLVGAESAMVLLSSKVIVNSSTQSFGTADFDWAGYDEYEFHIINILPATNAQSFQFQISEDGGTTFQSAANYGYSLLSFTSAVAATSSSNAVSILISPAPQRNTSTDAGFCCRLKLITPFAIGTSKAMVTYDVTLVNSGAAAFNGGGGIGDWVGDTNAYNGIKFFYGSGNILSGTIRAYGIKRS